MPTTYADGFNRTGPLVGTTPTGGGTWRTTAATSAETPSLSGTTLNIPAGVFAYLETGVGDVDMQARVYGAGTLEVRSGASSFRVRIYGESYSGGYYADAPGYQGNYSNYSGDCAGGNTRVRTQCNNSNFPSAIYENCQVLQGGTFVTVQRTFYLQSVVSSSSCRQYVSNSGTFYYAAFERVAADGSVTVLGTSSTNVQPVVRLLAQGTVVRAYIDGALLGTATDSDADSRRRGNHGLRGAGQFEDFVLVVLNTAPNAAQLLSPIDGAPVDRTSTLPLRWQFSDADASDTQSKYDISIKPDGGTAVVTTRVTGDQQHNVTAGSLPAGRYEWSVRTYDSQGEAGPWSPVGYFTAATPPPAPTWVTPRPGGVIPTQVFVAQWANPSQEAYRIRRTTAVDTPTAGQTYYDSGAVAAPTARTATLDFPVNGRVERVWVQVRIGGLWSSWAIATVTVDYAPPAAPVSSLTPISTIPGATAADGTDSLLVTITNPVPLGPQPEVLYNDVLLSADEGITYTRLATGVPTSGAWTYYWPAGRVNYRARVVAIGANGTSITAETTGSVPFAGIRIALDPGDLDVLLITGDSLEAADDPDTLVLTGAANPTDPDVLDLELST